MTRPILGTPALLLSLAATAWAQQAAPNADQQGGSPVVGMIMLISAIAFVVLMISLSRKMKTNMASVDRGLQMSEESIQLARQHVALQEETNRLLKQLISGQGRVGSE